MFARLCPALVALLAGTVALPAAFGLQDNPPAKVPPVPPEGTKLTPEVIDELKKGLAELQADIAAVDSRHQLLPDVLIYEKAVRWALDYNEVYDPKPGKDGKEPPPAAGVKFVLKSGLARAKELKQNKFPWTTQTGLVVRGYRSKIDGSVQPYGLVIPKDYDFAGKTPHRLDFWWHGRGETLSEANFIADRERNAGQFTPPNTLVLHPYGRYCNANKFAGEIDTLECLEHVQTNYRIDRNRVTARGFSMGGAACWQFATHYPTLWAAAAPGAGFSETADFLKVFQNEKVQPEWWEKKLWHMYDCTDYAANLFNVPTVAYSGEDDKQKQAADMMEKALKAEGMDLVHIIGPKTGHSYEKGAKVEVDKRIDAILAKGRDPVPAKLRFTTFTTRYNHSNWVKVLSLEKHWERARVDAEIKGNTIHVTTENVAELSINLNITLGQEVVDRATGVDKVIVDGTLHHVAPRTPPSILVHIHKVNGKWEGGLPPWHAKLRKVHGLQGPIDDAFMGPFIMVKPTGTPMNEAVGKWVDTEMKHATDHWRKQFRGDAIVKNDNEIGDVMAGENNLILWGDPQSNKYLARIADKLPIKWTKEGVTVGDKTYPAGTHVPTFVFPNPLPFHKNKYVVINSGFTFREYDYLNNARQVSKLPDYAVFDVTTPPTSRSPGKVVRAGFFGENWELQAGDGQ